MYETFITRNCTNISTFVVNKIFTKYLPLVKGHGYAYIHLKPTDREDGRETEVRMTAPFEKSVLVDGCGMGENIERDLVLLRFSDELPDANKWYLVDRADVDPESAPIAAKEIDVPGLIDK